MSLSEGMVTVICMKKRQIKIACATNTDDFYTQTN